MIGCCVWVSHIRILSRVETSCTLTDLVTRIGRIGGSLFFLSFLSYPCVTLFQCRTSVRVVSKPIYLCSWLYQTSDYQLNKLITPSRNQKPHGHVRIGSGPALTIFELLILSATFALSELFRADSVLVNSGLRIPVDFLVVCGFCAG